MNALPQPLMFRARLVRRWLRRTAARLEYRRLSLQDLPVLFANSFPKSGTHLLTQVLAGFTQLGPVVESGLPAIVTFEGESGRPRDLPEILADLDRLLPGDIAYGHLYARPEIVARLSRDGYASFFILRDPRDVVVSHVHYVSQMAPNHVHHRYYTEQLHDFDQRLRTSITGIPGSEALFPDVRARFEPYLGWLENQAVLSVHYEDFIHDRQAAVARVLDHAVARGFPLRVTRQAAIETLVASIQPQRSPTFRQGKAGGWKNSFEPQHKRLFKEVSGDLLIRLGYERDDDW